MLMIVKLRFDGLPHNVSLERGCWDTAVREHDCVLGHLDPLHRQRATCRDRTDDVMKISYRVKAVDQLNVTASDN